MDWSQTSRVLLEWPKDGKILQHRLDLVLLERYCSSNGSQLAVLTSDRQVIDQAEDAGIPVFQSRSTAQLRAWGKSQREFIRQDLVENTHHPRDLSSLKKDQENQPGQLSSWGRILSFSLGVAAVLAIGATLLPSAIVQIPAVINLREITIPVQAVPDQSGIQISGVIPSRTLEITVDQQASAASTGIMALPAEYARGEVIFTNLSDQEIFIPVNTVLSTDISAGPLFITTESGSLPGSFNSEITLPVQALEPGSSGNLPEFSISRISQELGAELIVANPSPISGGEDILIPAPSSGYHEKLISSLEILLLDQAFEMAAEELEPGDILITFDPHSTEILESSFDPELGSASDSLTISRTSQFLFYYASAADLQILAEQAVSGLYSESELSPNLGSIDINHLTDPVLGNGLAAGWQIQIVWSEKQNYNQGRIIQSILGKDPAEAGSLLRTDLNLRGQPEINIKPVWWVRVPILPFRITILEIIE